MGKPYTNQDVVQTLRSSSVKIIAIERVSNSMFKIEVDRNRTKYAKIVPADRVEAFETLIKFGTDIGMPKSRFIYGQPSIHLMDPAKGRTLSYEIPIGLIPGLHLHRGSQLKKGVHKLGRYLGKLHDSSASGEIVINYLDTHLDQQDAINEDGVNHLLKSKLSENLILDIEFLLDSIEPLYGKSSIIHGDIRLFHVYLSNSDVELIDFDSATKTVGATDLISFECSLALMISRLPWATRKKQDALLKELHQGYREQNKDAEVSERQWKLLKIIKYCSILLYYIERIEKDRHGFLSSKADITQTIDTKILKRLIRTNVTGLRKML